MKLATVVVDGHQHAARVGETEVDLLDAGDVGELLRREADRVQSLRTVPLTCARFRQPVVTPGKVICLGLNYVEHLREIHGDGALPEHPALFTKFADTLTGPREKVILPPASVAESFDWEVELAVVVGSEIARATEDEAARAIAGYTIANDISVRDWQVRTSEWLQGKAWDATTPMGPVLVTADEFDSFDHEISCEVNGVRKQRSLTSNLLVGPAAALAYISTFTTLRPGDIVLTGTPGGVGFATGERTLLRDGDIVTSRISGIGELTTTIEVAGSWT